MHSERIRNLEVRIETLENKKNKLIKTVSSDSNNESLLLSIIKLLEENNELLIKLLDNRSNLLQQSSNLKDKEDKIQKSNKFTDFIPNIDIENMVIKSNKTESKIIEDVDLDIESMKEIQ